MKKLGNKSRMYIKAIHIFFIATWLGGAIAMLLLPVGNVLITGEKFTQGFNFALKIINVFVIIPGAIGSIITGLIFSIFTNWGFFKNRWITVKYILTSIAILIGAIWVGPLIEDMIRLSSAKGFVRSQNPNYLFVEKKYLIIHLIQTIMIVYMIFISVLKPWKKTKSNK